MSIDANLQLVKFHEVDLNDPFFDSLKEGYKEFQDWFQRKENENAFVLSPAIFSRSIQ